MLKVFCKEQLEKQTVVHGMEMAQRTSAACGLGARWELAGSAPGPCWELARALLGARQELTSPGKGWRLPQETDTVADGLEWGDRGPLLGREVAWCPLLWNTSRLVCKCNGSLMGHELTENFILFLLVKCRWCPLVCQKPLKMGKYIP